MIKESIPKLFAVAIFTGLAGLAPVSAAEEEEATPLAKEMEEIDDALKELRRLKRADDKWTASAALMRKAQEHAAVCLALVPREIEALKDDPAKVKALADSRRLMGLMYVALCELELAFLSEDDDAVDAGMDKCKDIKKESHDKYYKEEE